MNKDVFITEEQRERALNQIALQDVKRVLSTDYGQRFLKYLLESLDFGKYPEPGLSEALLFERVGILRAGYTIFELIAAADAELAGYLVGQIEKGRYAKKD